MSRDLPALLDGLKLDEYYALLRRAIVGDHDPANVILLEIDPLHQKTLCDFLVTERLFGVRAVDVRALRREGNRSLVRSRRIADAGRANLQPRDRGRTGTPRH